MNMRQFVEIKTEPDRDFLGRPLIVPPSGGKAVPYQRCTTFVKAMDDTYNLMQWKARQVARGLSLRPDLQMRIVSKGPPPDDVHEPMAYKAWKKDMDKICSDAQEAAESSAASNIGTALHALTDRLDRGQPLGRIPLEYQPHLKAYEETTRHLTVMGIERFTVYDPLAVGGTFDRLLKVDGYGDKLFIGDTKSGKNLEWSMGTISMQLAMYAHSQLYDPTTFTRTPLGDVDLDKAIVIALNARKGTCELVWIDIAAGWEAVQLATQVKAWRARKDLSSPYTNDVLADAHGALTEAIQHADTIDALVELWNSYQLIWNNETHTPMAAARKKQLQNNHLTLVKDKQT